MNTSIWIALLIFFFLRIQQTAETRQIVARIRIKRKKEKLQMTEEMMKKLINQEVYVYSFSQSSFRGVIQSIEEGWLEVENKSGQRQYINTEYVTGILEIKTKKK